MTDAQGARIIVANDCSVAASRIDPQDPQPGAVVDGGELVVLRPLPPLGQGRRDRRRGWALFRESDRVDEFYVDLDSVAGLLLLVAGVALDAPLVPLGGGQPVRPEKGGMADLRLFEDPRLTNI
ncbi:hypothetical protein [Streptomyces chartreusis]|uniref:hypothetical protein n=1 Tax=Streptomyces chartreusis TaxID=1969 RepID=UPI00362824BF